MIANKLQYSYENYNSVKNSNLFTKHKYRLLKIDFTIPYNSACDLGLMFVTVLNKHMEMCNDLQIRIGDDYTYLVYNLIIINGV